MKIKTKKQLNLPQLIEYAWDNDVRNVTFRGLDKKGYVVSISINDKGEFSSDWRISKNVIFEVEVEEDVTEDTVFSELVGLRADDSYWKYENTCINDFNLEVINAVYIPNDDLTMTLIWKDGKLVE